MIWDSTPQIAKFLEDGDRDVVLRLVLVVRIPFLDLLPQLPEGILEGLETIHQALVEAPLFFQLAADLVLLLVLLLLLPHHRRRMAEEE